jgi:hypothetical protein
VPLYLHPVRFSIEAIPKAIQSQKLPIGAATSNGGKYIPQFEQLQNPKRPNFMIYLHSLKNLCLKIDGTAQMRFRDTDEMDKGKDQQVSFPKP